MKSLAQTLVVMFHWYQFELGTESFQRVLVFLTQSYSSSGISEMKTQLKCNIFLTTFVVLIKLIVLKKHSKNIVFLFFFLVINSKTIKVFITAINVNECQ